MNALAAWEITLELEYAVLYGYGIVGAQLGPDDRDVQRAIAVHTKFRDTCVAAISAAGAEPPAAAAAYSAPPIASDASARKFAADMEADCAYGYVQLVGNEDEGGGFDRDARETGIEWLRLSAMTGWRWTGAIPALPGLQ